MAYPSRDLFFIHITSKPGSGRLYSIWFPRDLGSCHVSPPYSKSWGLPKDFLQLNSKEVEKMIWGILFKGLGTRLGEHTSFRPTLGSELGLLAPPHKVLECSLAVHQRRSECTYWNQPAGLCQSSIEIQQACLKLTDSYWYGNDIIFYQCFCNIHRLFYLIIIDINSLILNFVRLWTIFYTY